MKFIPDQLWKAYISDKTGRINRRYYELCALWELRKALRSGNVWVEQSRRYADIQTYLMPPEQ